MNRQFWSREGKGKCLPLEGRPLVGECRSHPGELSGGFHGNTDKFAEKQALRLMEGCSAEQLVFLPDVLDCCDMCTFTMNTQIVQCCVTL